MAQVPRVLAVPGTSTRNYRAVQGRVPSEASVSRPARSGDVERRIYGACGLGWTRCSGPLGSVRAVDRESLRASRNIR